MLIKRTSKYRYLCQLFLVLLEEKMFLCKYCPKSFTRKYNAENHMRTHTNERPFVCVTCSKTFARTSALSRHKKIHSREKEFICNVCKRAFSRRDSRAIHLQTHTCVKPFTCAICAKSFGQISTLRKHLRMHTGLKPFSCLECSKTFSRRDNCIRHQQKTHFRISPLVFGNSDAALDNVKKASVQTVEVVEDEQLQLVQTDVEFFDCKSGLSMMALFDDFKDKRAFKTSDGSWMVETRKGRLSKAKRFGELTKFKNCHVAVWYGTSNGKVNLNLTEEFLRREAQRVRIKGTSPRSNWRTQGETWEVIANWSSSLTGRKTFDFLKGKVILEATTSDGFSTDFLRKNKDLFGFAEVVGCHDFFKYSLANKGSFDAVVSNPPWDEYFLKVLYEYLLFLKKPFVLILRTGGTRHHLFQKIFGVGSYRTIIP